MKNIRSLIVAIAAVAALTTAGFAASGDAVDCCKKDAACCANQEACCAPSNAKGSCCVQPEVNRCCSESATSDCCR